jgi:hypothetical protein
MIVAAASGAVQTGAAGTATMPRMHDSRNDVRLLRHATRRAEISLAEANALVAQAQGVVAYRLAVTKAQIARSHRRIERSAALLDAARRGARRRLRPA